MGYIWGWKGGHILVHVMGAKKGAHHKRLKLTTMKDVDPHSGSRYQHRGI